MRKNVSSRSAPSTFLAARSFVSRPMAHRLPRDTQRAAATNYARFGKMVSRARRSQALDKCHSDQDDRALSVRLDDGQWLGNSRYVLRMFAAVRNDRTELLPATVTARVFISVSGHFAVIGHRTIGIFNVIARRKLLNAPRFVLRSRLPAISSSIACTLLCCRVINAARNAASISERFRRALVAPLQASVHPLKPLLVHDHSGHGSI